MKTYYSELVVHDLSRRNQFLPSKETIRHGLEKGKQFAEVWRGWQLFRTSTPSEGDYAIGDFYIESDVANFTENKNVILDVVEFLEEKGLDRRDFTYFSTNRSIWVQVPAVLFGCYGHTKLPMIYKRMAKDVQSYLLDKGYKQGIDMSIYKHRGLVHALGSYLPKSKRWVQRFEYTHLEEALCMDDLSGRNYDTGLSYAEMTPVLKAVEWFSAHAAEKKDAKKITLSKDNAKRKHFIAKMLEFGFPEDNRNTHLYTLALALKDEGMDEDEVFTFIQSKFENPYLEKKEALRTIESALNGSKHFSGVYAQEMNDVLFEDFTYEKKNMTDLFVPRLFIEQLQSLDAPYQTYQMLLSLILKNQEDGAYFIMPLKGEKHKKRLIDQAMLLQEANIAQVSVREASLVLSLKWKERSVYRSHLILPKSRFDEMLQLGKLLPLFLELSRSAIVRDSKRENIHTNVKEATLIRKLKMSKRTLKVYLRKLQSLRFLLGQKLCTYWTKSIWAKKVVERFQRPSGGWTALFGAVKEAECLEMGDVVVGMDEMDAVGIPYRCSIFSANQ